MSIPCEGDDLEEVAGFGGYWCGCEGCYGVWDAAGWEDWVAPNWNDLKEARSSAFLVRIARGLPRLRDPV